MLLEGEKTKVQAGLKTEKMCNSFFVLFLSAGFIWLFPQYLSERSKYFASIWSCYGCSHAGSLFTNEEKKRLGLGHILILCHKFSALFMMSLKETSWHKMSF